MIILASKSPRRRDLLKTKIDNFLIIDSHIDENLSYDLNDPLLVVRDIAKRKALAVNKNHFDDIVISADTIVVLDNKIIHKPIDEKDAFHILKELSNKTHQVITAFAIIQKDKMILKHVISEVTFNLLDDKLINDYIASGSPLDKAGAYGIQDNNKYPIVKSYKGDYNNIVGFPLDDVINELNKF